MKSVAWSRRCAPPRSAFAGFRFPAEVIVVAVRWYMRYGLSYRDVEEPLAERGIEVGWALNTVDPYRDHLRRRRAEDPQIPVTRLLAEIRELGYIGSANLQVRYLNQGRAFPLSP